MMPHIFFSETGNAAGMSIFLSGPSGAVMAPALPRLDCHHNDAVLSVAGVPANPLIVYAVLVPSASANLVTRGCREQKKKREILLSRSWLLVSV